MKVEPKVVEAKPRDSKLQNVHELEVHLNVTQESMSKESSLPREVKPKLDRAMSLQKFSNQNQRAQQDIQIKQAPPVQNNLTKIRNNSNDQALQNVQKVPIIEPQIPVKTMIKPEQIRPNKEIQLNNQNLVAISQQKPQQTGVVPQHRKLNQLQFNNGVKILQQRGHAVLGSQQLTIQSMKKLPVTTFQISGVKKTPSSLSRAKIPQSYVQPQVKAFVPLNKNSSETQFTIRGKSRNSYRRNGS